MMEQYVVKLINLGRKTLSSWPNELFGLYTVHPKKLLTVLCRLTDPIAHTSVQIRLVKPIVSTASCFSQCCCKST